MMAELALQGTEISPTGSDENNSDKGDLNGHGNDDGDFNIVINIGNSENSDNDNTRIDKSSECDSDNVCLAVGAGPDIANPANDNIINSNSASAFDKVHFASSDPQLPQLPGCLDPRRMSYEDDEPTILCF